MSENINLEGISIRDFTRLKTLDDLKTATKLKYFRLNSVDKPLNYKIP